MNILLKVTPKGQVTLPKLVRDQLGVGDLAEVRVEGKVAILKKPDITVDKLAGSFQAYGRNRDISLKKALDQATEMVADEVAKKDH
jgi:AbrB family looped-hinge helix DNA binding protein